MVILDCVAGRFWCLTETLLIPVVTTIDLCAVIANAISWDLLLGAIHLLRTHKFSDFRTTHPPTYPVRTNYDVIMTTIHMRTHGV